jgi:hypothetical protein
MERTADEAEYVLAVLQRMRGEVCANPELFDRDAQERIDEAIFCIRKVIQSTRTQLMIYSVQDETKAA